MLGRWHSLAAALVALPVLWPIVACALEEPVRGVVRASQEAWLSTELNARIRHIPRKEGDAFAKGDPLISFDCQKYESELRAARAEQEVNWIVYNNSLELDRRKAIGRFEVDQNKAKFEKAKAQADTLAVRTSECTILAPFDGRVSELKAREHEISSPNQPLIRIVATANLEIEMILPSHSMRWLRVQTEFPVKIDETESEHTARVQRIAATVDSVSQTVKIFAVFTRADERILPGMSLTASIKPPAP
jgi:RND family efflux transporter MFP subunit